MRGRGTGKGDEEEAGGGRWSSVGVRRSVCPSTGGSPCGSLPRGLCQEPPAVVILGGQRDWKLGKPKTER